MRSRSSVVKRLPPTTVNGEFQKSTPDALRHDPGSDAHLPATFDALLILCPESVQFRGR